MDFERALRQASVDDRESLAVLFRELERRGFGGQRLKIYTVHEKIINHPEVDLSILEECVLYFNGTPTSQRKHLIKDLPVAVPFRTMIAFLSSLEERNYKTAVVLKGEVGGRPWRGMIQEEMEDVYVFYASPYTSY